MLAGHNAKGWGALHIVTILPRAAKNKCLGMPHLLVLMFLPIGAYTISYSPTAVHCTEDDARYALAFVTEGIADDIPGHFHK